jgi:hypothetical protein
MEKKDESMHVGALLSTGSTSNTVHSRLGVLVSPGALNEHRGGTAWGSEDTDRMHG